MYYGLVDKSHIRVIALVVCDTLGHGANGNAADFLCEIAAQETHSGCLMDRHTTKAGVGLMQIDRICFDDVVARTRDSVWDDLKENHGIERNVSYEMLAYSPLLAIVFARLFLRLIPEEFPDTREARAEYWKNHYNTELGAGTPEEYLLNCECHLS